MRSEECKPERNQTDGEADALQQWDYSRGYSGIELTRYVDLAQDAELRAMMQVFAALKDLDIEAQNRVLDYVERRLGLNRASAKRSAEAIVPDTLSPARAAAEGERQVSVRVQPEPDQPIEAEEEADAGELEGISPVARKWMRQKNLSAATVSQLFSLGVEDIDLVATKVPGDSTRERMHNVMLLQGVASYLSSGVARIDRERLRDAMRHYDADVGKNSRGARVGDPNVRQLEPHQRLVN